MSADNAIYIRPMLNGNWRVACLGTFVADSLNDEQIDEQFANAPEFGTLSEAWSEEDRIQDKSELDGCVIEYGSEIISRQNVSREYETARDACYAKFKSKDV